MPEQIEGFRLSPQQDRLWDLAAEAGERGYLAACAVAIDGMVEARGLGAALRQAVERHEILRTCFRHLPAMIRPLQVIGEAALTGPAVADLAALAPRRQEDCVGALLHHLGEAAFDLERGPLLRVLLVRLGAGRWTLLVRLPALCADATTLVILAQELAGFCGNGAGGVAVEDVAQYADLSEWCHELLESQQAVARKYWQDLDLLAWLAPRPPAGKPAGRFAPRRHAMALPPDLPARLEALATGAATTVPAVLLAAWAALLGRLAGRSRLVVGTAYDGRKHREMATALGPLARFLPLACELPPELPFVALARQAGEAMAELHKWQELFSWQAFAGNGAGGGDGEARAAAAPAAYFPHCFEMQIVPPRLEAGGASFAVDRCWADVDRFEVKLTCTLRGDSMTLDLRYDASAVERAAAGRLADRFQALLEDALARPTAALGELELLPVEERRCLLDLARGPVVPRAAATLPELCEAQARRAPDRVAAAAGERCLTFAALDGRADQLARRLLALGVAPEAPVALLLERSLEMVAAILGVLKAGAAYLPLDPADSGERLRFLIEDTRAPVLLTQEPLLAGLPELRQVPVHVLCLDADAGASTAGAASALTIGGVGGVGGVGAAADGLAYVIYTSGSTGRPKGVMVSHRAILNRLLWMQEALPLGVADRLLQKTPYTFDASIWELFLPLISGACLVIARPGGHQDPPYLRRIIEESGVTVAQFVPSLLAVFLEQAESGAGAAGLRRVFCGGEALSQELARRFHQRLDAELYNLYGPTETAIDAAYHACGPDAAALSGAILPIGRPLPNLEIYVLDDRLRLVPQGQPGELCIGGVGLARGYLGRPDLTAERFIPHPWPVDAGARLYRTGDLVRQAADGTYEFLGRIDQQVKLRGFRIELGEIEAVLLGHPGVREAAVAVREDVPGDQRLVAYLVAPGEEPPAGELRDLLLRKLPEYMVPSRWMMLPALPRTGSGKVDRRALPAPDPARPEIEAPFVAPRTRTETMLAGIWCEVLQLDRVGVHDNFFDLGGHSLIAVRVASRVRQAYGVQLQVRKLFEAPTVARLALAVEEAMVGGAAPEAMPGTALAAPALTRVPREPGADLALSFAQQRLWFLQQLEPESPAYNIPGALQLAGPLDPLALAAAFSALVERHETLRTTFKTVAGDPVQVIGPPAPVHLPRVDLTVLAAPADLSQAGREAEVRRLAQATARRVFDLATGPLLRLVLLRLGEREHVLLFNMHHIVSDAWSVGVLVRELSQLYAGYRHAAAVRLDELPVQYADFASWQRRWLQGAALAAQLAYWRQQLAGAPEVLDLPLDRPRPAIPTYRGTVRARELPVAAVEALRRLSRDAQATLYITLLAAFKTLLHRYGAGDDLVVGTNVANRGQLGIEGLIGFFANALALRTRLGGDPPFLEALARVRETALGAFAHQDLPFDRLVEELQPRRNLAVSPLYQVVFDLEVAREGSGLALEDLTIAPLPLAAATAKFDLTLTGRDLGTGLVLAAEINTDVFDEATADSLLDHLTTLLQSIAGGAGARSSELALLRDAELRQLLHDFQGERRSYPVDRTLAELFALQVRRTPDAVAAVCGDGCLSYRELDRGAGCLAACLRQAGVGPGQFVGVLEERNLGFLTALVGILEAGGAYLPIDPAYPDERVRFMIADSGISTLIARTRQRERAAALAAGCPELRRLVDLDVHTAGGVASAAGAAAAGAVGAAAAADPAYMLYTSGSTGSPKGVVIRHDGAVNHIYAQIETLGLGAELSFLQSAPSSSDISVWQFLAPLLIGGRTVIVDAETVAAPERLLASLQRQGITLVELVPSVLRALLDHAGELAAAERALPALRWMMATGETVPVELINDWFGIYPGIRAVNAYGPTEASDDVTQLLIDGPLPAGTRSLAIGRPLANFSCYVLDRQLRPVPARVPGELAIGGIGVGGGYWRNPGRTAESFVPNPFTGTGGEIMYRTGDRVRWLPDGNLEFLGRLDHQVKVRGFRLELGEIEAALAAHPQVRESAATVRPEPGGGQLVAYLVAAEGTRPAPGALRGFLKQRLPEPLIPAVFVFLDAMPRTASGKVDRPRLPAPDALPREAAAPAAPRTAAEATLAQIWSEVLGRDAVGVESDFFELGGHSLLVMRVLSRVRAAFDVELPLRSLFQHPTVAQLAAAVEAARLEARRAALPAIRRVSRKLEGLNEPVPPPAEPRRLLERA
jgi:amino acid adenylation domain-containing protein